MWTLCVPGLWRAAWPLSQERLDSRGLSSSRELTTACLSLAHQLACVWFRNVTCSYPVALSKGCRLPLDCPGIPWPFQMAVPLWFF